MNQKSTRTEYMCRFCGQKHLRMNVTGRPLPGKCPRRPGNQPHSWVINRKF